MPRDAVSEALLIPELEPDADPVDMLGFVDKFAAEFLLSPEGTPERDFAARALAIAVNGLAEGMDPRVRAATSTALHAEGIRRAKAQLDIPDKELIDPEPVIFHSTNGKRLLRVAYAMLVTTNGVDDPLKLVHGLNKGEVWFQDLGNLRGEKLNDGS
jgi:hypothetical protein